MSSGTLASLAGSAVGLAIVVVCGIEAVLLARGEPPLTSYGRYLVRRWPGAALVIGAMVLVSVGMLTAHFIWDASCG